MIHEELIGADSFGTTTLCKRVWFTCVAPRHKTNGIRLTTSRSRFELCIKRRGDVCACAQGYNISCAQG